MGTKLVPRWIWKRVEVPQSGTVIVDPADFANTTPYPMKLHWMSVTGTPAQGSEPYDTDYGGVTRRLTFELGVTGYSDINLVPANGAAIFCPRDYRQKDYSARQFLSANQGSGVEVWIPRAQRIPQDGGLVVEVENTIDYTLNDDVSGNMIGKSIIASGYRDDTKIPGFLAGRLNESLPIGAKMMLNSSDLLNAGREDFIITSLTIDCADTGYYSDRLGFSGYDQYPQMTGISWRINPVSGVEWMPQDDPIPAGNLAGFCRGFDYQDVGPKVYPIPYNTMLMPRQRFGVKITELSAAAQEINICVHGELEVQ